MPVRNWQKLDTLPPSFLGVAKADDILGKFETGVSKKIHKVNDLLLVASDGPNVNLLFLKLCEGKRCLNELPALLDIGTRGIRTIHGSLKNAEKASEWDFGKVLKSMSKILMDTPARKKTFEKITESDVYQLPCCGHRRCENENCLHRAVEVWPAFNTFVKHLMKLPKAKQLAKGEWKSFLVLKKAVDDPLIQAKMKFLELLSSKLNEFLRGFQTDQPRTLFLAETLETLLRSFMNIFILSVMLKADTQKNYWKLIWQIKAYISQEKILILEGG